MPRKPRGEGSGSAASREPASGPARARWGQAEERWGPRQERQRGSLRQYRSMWPYWRHRGHARGAASKGRTERSSQPTDNAPRSRIAAQSGASPTIFMEREGIHVGVSGAPTGAAGLRRLSRIAWRIPRSRSKSDSRWALVARSSSSRASGVQELSTPVSTMAERGGWADEGTECQAPRGAPKSHTKSEVRAN